MLFRSHKYGSAPFIAAGSEVMVGVLQAVSVSADSIDAAKAVKRMVSLPLVR